MTKAVDLANVINADGVALPQIARNGLFFTSFAARTSQQSLVGDSGWVDHLTSNVTVAKQCSLLIIYSSSSSFESGPVQGFARLLVDGTMVGFNSCVAKQSTANAAGSGTVFWDVQNIAAGAHTIKVQVRNTQGGSTWVTPYFDADGQTANTLGLIFY
jgi:glucose dehydrogenase